MNTTTAKLLVKGLATYLPGYLEWHQKYRAQPPGGAVTPEYCYSVWLRHLVLAGESGLNTNPSVVGELGPGASVGVGICAILAGANSYFGLDASDYVSRELSASLVPGIVNLLRARAPIPGEGSHRPALQSSAFPAHILTDDRLSLALSPDRVAAVTAAVSSGQAGGVSIRYVAPWDDPNIIPAGSLDMVLSQAVLEHVEAIGPVYRAMHSWLKPGGFMSNQIDYKSHGTSETWDGHWEHSDLIWAVLHGKRRAEINRLPHSSHMREVSRLGLTLTKEIAVRSKPTIARNRLNQRFKDLSDDDLSCSGAFIQAVK